MVSGLNKSSIVFIYTANVLSFEAYFKCSAISTTGFPLLIFYKDLVINLAVWR